MIVLEKREKDTISLPLLLEKTQVEASIYPSRYVICIHCEYYLHKKKAKSSQQRTSKTSPNGPNPLSPLLSQLNTQSEPDYNTHILKRIPSHSLSNWNFVQNCALCGHIHTTPKPNTRTNKQSKWRHIGIFRLPTAKPKDKRRIKKVSYEHQRAHFTTLSFHLPPKLFVVPSFYIRRMRSGVCWSLTCSNCHTPIRERTLMRWEMLLIK